MEVRLSVELTGHILGWREHTTRIEILSGFVIPTAKHVVLINWETMWIQVTQFALGILVAPSWWNFGFISHSG